MNRSSKRRTCRWKGCHNIPVEGSLLCKTHIPPGDPSRLPDWIRELPFAIGTGLAGSVLYDGLQYLFSSAHWFGAEPSPSVFEDKELTDQLETIARHLHDGDAETVASATHRLAEIVVRMELYQLDQHLYVALAEPEEPSPQTAGKPSP